MDSPFDQQPDFFEAASPPIRFINIRQFWTPAEIMVAVLIAATSVVALFIYARLGTLGSLPWDAAVNGGLAIVALPAVKYFHSRMDLLITAEGIRLGDGASNWLRPLRQSGYRPWAAIHRAEWVWGVLPAHQDLLALKSDAPDLLVRMSDYVPDGATKQQIAAHRAMLKKRHARNWLGRPVAPASIEALPLFSRLGPALLAHGIQPVQVGRLWLSGQYDLAASREGRHVLALMGMLAAFIFLELVMRMTKTAPELWWYSLFAAALLAAASFIYLRKGLMPYAEATGVSLVLLAVAVPAVHEFAEHLNMWTDSRPSAEMSFRYVGASTLEPVAGNQPEACVPEPLVADGYETYWKTRETGAITRLPVYCGLGFWQIDIKPLAAVARQ